MFRVNDNQNVHLPCFVFVVNLRKDSDKTKPRHVRSMQRLCLKLDTKHTLACVIDLATLRLRPLSL
jgi:hypothetical protein